MSRVALNSVKTLVAVVVLGTFAESAFGAEVSMVSGFYKSESRKDNGTKTGSSSAVDLAGRFGDDLTTSEAWFAQAGLNLRSYNDAGGATAPDNSTGILLGGGVRHYFSPYGESSVPFVSGMVSYENDKSVDFNGGGTYDEVSRSGIYYGAGVGIRLGLNREAFVEFECQLFKSALFATETVESTDAAGNKSKTERNRTELYVASSGALDETTIALGMKL
jgi:hypothetical protein